MYKDGRSKPIRCIGDLQRIYRAMIRSGSHREASLFKLAVNTPLKLSLLIELTHRQVDHDTKEIHLDEKIIPINNIAHSEILNRLIDAPSHYYIFQKSDKEEKPITVQWFGRVLSNTIKKLGIEEKISGESLRKTFGYHAYKQGATLETLMQIYQQPSITKTTEYLMINRDLDLTVNEVLTQIELD